MGFRGRLSWRFDQLWQAELRALACIFGLLLALGSSSMSALGAVVISINKNTQQLSVSVDGERLHQFTVSTGRAGYGTPTGTFRPQSMAKRWFSRKYYNSPMPYSIFFHRGYAIHG